MKDKSIKQYILDYLKVNDWVWGGHIEIHIRNLVGSKASNVSRRCRELENEGVIERRLVQVSGKGAFVTQYRLKRQVIAGLQMKEMVLSDNK